VFGVRVSGDELVLIVVRCDTELHALMKHTSAKVCDDGLRP
jgi:hypothetical protein